MMIIMQPSKEQAVIHNTHPGNKKHKGGTGTMETTIPNKNKKRPGRVNGKRN